MEKYQIIILSFLAGAFCLTALLLFSQLFVKENVVEKEVYGACYIIMPNGLSDDKIIIGGQEYKLTPQ